MQTDSQPNRKQDPTADGNVSWDGTQVIVYEDYAWVENETLILPIKEEIWRLVQQAPSMSAVHWLVALDDCFENHTFNFEDFPNMRWRLSAIKSLGFDTGNLYSLIEEAIGRSNLNKLSELYEKDRL